MADEQEVNWSAVGGVLTLVTILSVGAARLAYQDLYAQLGVSLDEVGLPTGRMVTRGALGVLLVSGLLAVVFGPPMHAASREPTRWQQVALTVLGSLVLFASLRFVPGTAFFVVGLLVAMGLPVSFLLRARVSERIRPWVLSIAGTQLVMVVVLVLAVVVTAADAGRRLARTGDDGKGVAAVLLDVPAPEVCVKGPSMDNERRLLLGSANGMTVLYDVEDEVATRVPTSRLEWAATCPPDP